MFPSSLGLTRSFSILLAILRFCCPFTNSTSKVKNLSGLEINTPKTEGMWLASWKNKIDMPFGFRWPQDPIKGLGIFFL